jgi:hypothetical protein
LHFRCSTLFPFFKYAQVRAAALNFATAIAHESHSQRRGKHDFAEVVKAVVQLMAKDGRCEALRISFSRIASSSVRSCVLFFQMFSQFFAVLSSELQQRGVANVLDLFIFDILGISLYSHKNNHP